MYGLVCVLSIVSGGGINYSRSIVHYEECLTKHGVTHCWEKLGSWDPIPTDYYPHPMNDYPVDKLETPKDYGNYATEKRADR